MWKPHTPKYHTYPMIAVIFLLFYMCDSPELQTGDSDLREVKSVVYKEKL